MKLDTDFYKRDVLDVAPVLLGKNIVRRFKDGRKEYYVITETEAYRGEEDSACHAHKGRTPRTDVMYYEGGVIYVYLIYGKYWMLNIVTGSENDPQAVLIRGVKEINGPGRVGRQLALDKTFYGEDICASERLWIEDGPKCDIEFTTSSRIGIEYASEEWRLKEWRYILID